MRETIDDEEEDKGKELGYKCIGWESKRMMQMTTTRNRRIRRRKSKRTIRISLHIRFT